VTLIRAASKQGSSIGRKEKTIKNVIKSGSTSTQEIMAHNPWLTSITQTSETNKHVIYIINCQTRKQNQEWILNASTRIIVPPEDTHLMNTSRQGISNGRLSSTLGVDPQGRFVAIPHKKHCHITLQVSTVHHNQADVVYVEEREWCIRETATATPIKKTQNMSSKSRFKTSFKGAVSNIKGTPQQPWIKREDDLDGYLYHCTWNSKMTNNRQSNTESEGFAEYEDSQSAQRMFAIQVRIIGPPSLGCSFVHPSSRDQIFGDFQSAQSVFAAQVRIIGPPSVGITKSVLFANQTMEEYKIQLPASMVKVNKSITTLLHAPVVLDIGQ
jgi:hypothetical protein